MGRGIRLGCDPRSRASYRQGTDGKMIMSGRNASEDQVDAVADKQPRRESNDEEQQRIESS